MSVSARLREYLDQNNVKYVSIAHSKAYTAQEVAQSMHVKGKEIAKTVILKVDDKPVMAVLPASHKVNIDALCRNIGGREARLATEDEFRDLFNDCEIGAMPPFGNLYGLPVYMSEALQDDEEIFFNAGTHTDAIKMRLSDYVNLVNPIVARFAEQAAGQAVR